MVRLLVHLLLTTFYGGIWLALALLFSTLFRQPATAALGSLAVWLFVTIFWDMIANLLGSALRPVETIQDLISQTELIQALTRLSPNTLYVEATLGLLNPATRSLGLVLPGQLQGMILGAPLPLGESLLLIWPHLTGLIAATMVLFAIGYVIFQRQEIRA